MMVSMISFSYCEIKDFNFKSVPNVYLGYRHLCSFSFSSTPLVFFFIVVVSFYVWNELIKIIIIIKKRILLSHGSLDVYLFCNYLQYSL